MTDYNEVDCESWTFEVDGFPLDAPQQLKSKVSEEHGYEYKNLRAKLIIDTFTTYCVVVRTVH